MAADKFTCDVEVHYVSDKLPKVGDTFTCLGEKYEVSEVVIDDTGEFRELQITLTKKDNDALRMTGTITSTPTS